MSLEIAKKMAWLVAILTMTSSPILANCLQPPTSTEAIEQFKSNPSGLISGSNTALVETTTRELAGTDPKLAPDLVHVAEGAAPRFRAAIAAGLAQAALACLNVDQGGALEIQQAVAGFQDGEFQSLFAAVAGDLSTAATFAAVSAANSSVGSVVIVNPNRSPGKKNQFSGGGGTGSSNNAIGILDTVGQNVSGTLGRTASSPVSATR
jgi:hypothetical protein